METVPAGQFKVHCLALLDKVAQKGEMLIVTKHGKPVARILPVEKQKDVENPLKHSIVFEGDLLSPISETWEVLK